MPNDPVEKRIFSRQANLPTKSILGLQGYTRHGRSQYRKKSRRNIGDIL